MPTTSRPLQVVHLCTSDSAGGAAIAAQRLMMAQREAGLEASMLVLHASHRKPAIHALRSDSACSRGLAMGKKALEVGAAWVSQGFRRAHLFDVSLPIAGFSLKRHPLILQADVIHIHWINQGFLGLSSLRDLVQLKKKVPFTMSGLLPLSAITLETAAVLLSLGGVMTAPSCNPGFLSSIRHRGSSVLSRLSIKSYPPLLWGVASGLQPRLVSHC